MVKKTGLTSGVAAAVGLPLPAVNLYYRALSEGGLLTSNGARGVNALPLTTLDAARLLIAVMVTDKPSEAVGAVQDFGVLTYQGDGFPKINLLSPRYSSEPPADKRFERVLAELLKDFRHGLDSAYDCLSFEVSLEPTKIKARIVLPDKIFEFGDRNEQSGCEILFSERMLRWHRHMQVTRTVKGDVLEAVAALFREVDDA